MCLLCWVRRAGGRIREKGGKRCSLGRDVPGGLADLEGCGREEGRSTASLAQDLSAGHLLVCVPDVLHLSTQVEVGH